MEFYCDILGAVVVLRPGAADNFDGRRAIVMLSDQMAFDVNEFAANVGNAFDPACTGLDHLSFAADSFEAMEAWAARLDERGVAHSPISEIAGGVGVHILHFRDPDGIQLEFVYMDRSGAWAKRKQDLAGAGPEEEEEEEEDSPARLTS
jgi:catechol 2,3-dioxygenase-like lactoylglutathione lyase family enzyme